MKQRRLPAEWEPQSGVMLTWPHAYGDWGTILAEVEQVYQHIACEISQREKVLIVCADAKHKQAIEQALQKQPAKHDRLRFAIAPSNDVWARDHGPITVDNGSQLTLLNFIFNGWGNKYSSDLDNQINARLQDQQVWDHIPLLNIDFVLEGGGIESDGQGTLMVTSSCLLAPTRNKDMSRGEVETVLRETLGTQRFLWLEHGYLAGDDTDGHIDTLARFCDPDTIAYVSCDDPQDEHFASLKAMEAELQAFRTREHKPYRLVALPFPAVKTNADGDRLPATYANFLIINQAVLVPTYRDPRDSEALRVLADCFPDREIVAIDCLPLIQQFGSLHCITMQLPASILS